MLKSFQGITYVEALAERDGDAITYMIEAAPGQDIRQKLFFALAERSWPLIGLEALGLSLEDIFISVVDKSDSDTDTPRYTRRKNRSRTALESQVGADLYTEAGKRRAESASVVIDDEE